MPQSIKDYYAILGVDASADADEIKKAFRAKARECHPDVCETDDAEDRFKEINEAYEVLSDARKRDVYDRFGTTDPRAQGAGGFDGVPFEDIFGMDMNDVFSMFFGGGQRTGRRKARKEGHDLSTRLVIPLEEVATGSERSLDLNRDIACDGCGGTGGEDAEVKTCPDCNGAGQRASVRQTFLGAMQSVAPCERCEATGEVVENACTACGGSGRAAKRETVTVPITPGMQDGASVRLPGMGEAGIRGANAGDLLVNVRIAPHESVFRQGDDLHAQVRVPYTKAALGGQVRFQGLVYEEEAGIPPGTQHGDVVRVKGRGLPRTRGRGVGDLMVHVAVDVPKRLDEEERRLLEDLASRSGDGVSRVDPVDSWLGRR